MGNPEEEIGNWLAKEKGVAPELEDLGHPPEPPVMERRRNLGSSPACQAVGLPVRVMTSWWEALYHSDGPPRVSWETLALRCAYCATWGQGMAVVVPVLSQVADLIQLRPGSLHGGLEDSWVPANPSSLPHGATKPRKGGICLEGTSSRCHHGECCFFIFY